MILQALTQLFEDLVAQEKISRPGWSPAKISYALCLDENGALEYVVPTMAETQVGKKTQLRPTSMELPAAVVRSSGVLPNFLWDNSSYLLGVDEKGKPERSERCFEACRQLHHQLLDEVDTPVAKAILAYFDTWQPKEAQNHPALTDYWQEITKGVNLVFRVVDTYAQDDPAIRKAWNDSYSETEGEKQQCLITGNLHQSIQRLRVFWEHNPAVRRWFPLMRRPSVPMGRSRALMRRWEKLPHLPIQRR